MASTALVERLFSSTENAVSTGVRNFDVPGVPSVKDINAVPVKEKFVRNFNTAYKQNVLDATEPVSSWRSKFNSLGAKPVALAAATGGALIAVGAGHLLSDLALFAEASGDEQAAQILSEMANQARELRASNTGDGEIGTTSGIPDDQVDAVLVIQDAQYTLIDMGAGALGSVDAFKKLREAIFAVEDKFLEKYIQNWPNGRPNYR